MSTPDYLSYLQIMDIPVWVRRNLPLQPLEELATELLTSPEITPKSHIVETTASVIIEIAPILQPSMPEMTTTAIPITPLDLTEWENLRSQVAACTACSLHLTRKQTVFGVGDKQADWLIVGEAPGADEDEQGEPFVGRAGKLLTSMLQAIGLSRDAVYIANVLKCRPPDNRVPTPEERVSCTPFLQQQIALLRPKLIFAVGSTAAQYLLNTDTAIGKLRGQRWFYQGVPLIATYHPAYLLRRPTEKRKAWQDLQLAQRIFNEASHVSQS
jgi:DNA polymerase